VRAARRAARVGEPPRRHRAARGAAIGRLWRG